MIEAWTISYLTPSNREGGFEAGSRQGLLDKLIEYYGDVGCGFRVPHIFEITCEINDVIDRKGTEFISEFIVDAEEAMFQAQLEYHNEPSANERRSA